MGHAAEVPDPAVRTVSVTSVRAERDGKTWPSFDAGALFELRVDRCLLMLTQGSGSFPPGPTIWRWA